MESLSMSAAAAIRRLRSDDAAAFKAIRLEALKASPELLRSSFELEDKLDVAWFAGRLEEADVIGAFRDGELVGTRMFEADRFFQVGATGNQQSAGQPKQGRSKKSAWRPKPILAGHGTNPSPRRFFNALPVH